MIIGDVKEACGLELGRGRKEKEKENPTMTSVLFFLSGFKGLLLLESGTATFVPASSGTRW